MSGGEFKHAHRFGVDQVLGFDVHSQVLANLAQCAGDVVANDHATRVRRECHAVKFVRLEVIEQVAGEGARDQFSGTFRGLFGFEMLADALPRFEFLQQRTARRFFQKGGDVWRLEGFGPECEDHR